MRFIAREDELHRAEEARVENLLLIGFKLPDAVGHLHRAAFQFDHAKNRTNWFTLALSLAAWDAYPIGSSGGHALIIARRPVAWLHRLTPAEKARLLVWIHWTQEHLSSKLSPTPDAFNLGLNDGPAAGQTMPQFHFHVIPRYPGALPDPCGGIRHVIPSKARYW